MSDHPGAGATAAPLSATHVDHAACVRADASLTRAFAFLGKRWNAILLRALGSGPAGFRELAREVVGISDSVLSDRLGDLAATGLIVRTVSEGPPVSVSYALTPRGEALMPALDQISQWAAEYLPEVPDGSC